MKINWNQEFPVKMILHIGNTVIAEKTLNHEPNIKEKLQFRAENGGQGAVSFEYI